MYYYLWRPFERQRLIIIQILLLGIILSTGASGTSPLGLFWMLVVARGIAGVGAGGEYPVAGNKNS